MFDEKIGIAVVCETHLSAQQATEIQEDHILGRCMDIYHSPNPDNPSTRGIAIVLNRELTNTKGIQTYYLIPGRAILVVVPWHGKQTHTILGVYAPAESMEENEKFWDTLTELYMTTDLPIPDSLGGDFNLVEEPIDRMPHRRYGQGAKAALARFKRLLDLKDGWRTINPDTKYYTFTSPHHSETLSRIDRFYVSPAVLKHSRHWSISDAAGGLTDHRMVSFQLSAPGSPYIGKGRYSMPLFLLRDKDLLEFTIKRGCELEVKIDASPDDKVVIQRGFKEYKDDILTFAH
jgi:exonuclease III